MIRRTVALLVLASSSLLASAALTNCNGGIANATGFGKDDWNSTTLTQCAADFITSGSMVGGADWILKALDQAGYNLANNWDVNYAGAGAGGSQLGNYTVNTYQAWAVSEPDVTAPDGSVTPGRAAYQNVDAGGAVFVFSYDSIDDAAPSSGIHFIQAYRQSLNGGPYTIHLDGTGVGNPYYDTNGVHGTTPGHPTSYWFLDTPLDCETGNTTCGPEGIEDYHTDVQFNVLMAVDNGIEGINDPHPGARSVSLYGGFAWGYTYYTSDVSTPEPSYAILVAFTLIGIALKRRKRAA